MSDPRTPGSWSGFPRANYRIDARAPQAVVKQGLESPTNAIGKSAWLDTFRNTSPDTQKQGLIERRRLGANMSNPDTYSGISHEVVDSIMGPGHWGRTIGQSMPTGAAPSFASAGPTGAIGASMPSGSSSQAIPSFSAGSRLPFGASAIGVPEGSPMISSKYGYAVNRAPSFLWSKAFAQNMNGNG